MIRNAHNTYTQNMQTHAEANTYRDANTHNHRYIHTLTHTCTCTRTHACMHVRIHTGIHTHTRTQTRMHARTQTRTHIHTIARTRTHTRTNRGKRKVHARFIISMQCFGCKVVCASLVWLRAPFPTTDLARWRSGLLCCKSFLVVVSCFVCMNARVCVQCICMYAYVYVYCCCFIDILSNVVFL